MSKIIICDFCNKKREPDELAAIEVPNVEEPDTGLVFDICRECRSRLHRNLGRNPVFDSGSI